MRAQVPSSMELSTELRQLREQVATQQQQIDQLRLMLDEQRSLLRGLAGAPVPAGSAFVPAPMVAPAATAPVSTQNPQSANASTDNVDALRTKVEELSHELAGFKFSGDFRYRLDMQLRSANDIAGPLQNIRSRYRLRLNLDKDLDHDFGFHMQLSTGPFRIQTTNDQDMGGMGAKKPFSLSEASVDFHPGSHLSMRGGRMEEVFADNMRFVWDDDIRFDGFQQIARVSWDSGILGFQHLELRSAEYILSNPAVYALPSSSFYVAAGYLPGQKVRDAQLFHPGFVLRGDLNSRWTHQFTGDIQVYRNANQIQLSSTSAGIPVVSDTIGVQLPLPIPTVGNATTTPGGAIYTAGHFQIVRAAYRLERKGVLVGGREMPFWVDFQASRNVGAGSLRDGIMASANLGAVRKFGDMRFLYQFVIKDANSLVSQFTDDDLGTGTGVNILVHALRWDFGLTRYLQWQNLLFLQSERRANNPADRFFVPLQRGSNETFRYLGQLAFSF